MVCEQALKKKLDSHGEVLRSADQLGLALMNSCPRDVAQVQEMVDEYQNLWRDITERLRLLTEASQDECHKKNVSTAVDNVDNVDSSCRLIQQQGQVIHEVGSFTSNSDV